MVIYGRPVPLTVFVSLEFGSSCAAETLVRLRSCCESGLQAAGGLNVTGESASKVVSHKLVLVVDGLSFPLYETFHRAA